MPDLVDRAAQHVFAHHLREHRRGVRAEHLLGDVGEPAGARQRAQRVVIELTVGRFVAEQVAVERDADGVVGKRPPAMSTPSASAGRQRLRIWVGPHISWNAPWTPSTAVMIPPVKHEAIPSRRDTRGADEEDDARCATGARDDRVPRPAVQRRHHPRDRTSRRSRRGARRRLRPRDQERRGTSAIVEIEGVDHELAALRAIVGDVNGLIAEEDIVDLASSLAAGESAGIFLFEPTWAIDFAAAVNAAAGRVLASVRIPPEVVDEVAADKQQDRRSA